MEKMSKKQELDLGRMIDVFSVNDILELLTGAWEGGSNYWIESVEMKGSYDLEQRPNKYYPSYALAPFIGGKLAIHLTESDGGEVHNLTEKKIRNGIKLIREKHPKHYANWVGQDDDAETSDVFLQLCLFKEVIFG